MAKIAAAAWVVWLIVLASTTAVWVVTGDASTDTTVGRLVTVGFLTSAFGFIPAVIATMIWADA